MAEQEKRPKETEEFGLVRNDDVDFSEVKRRRRVSPLRRAAGLAAFAAAAVILAAVLEHRFSTTKFRAVGADERLDDSLARAHARGRGKRPRKKVISRAKKCRVVLAYNRFGKALNAAYDCLDTADVALRAAVPVVRNDWEQAAEPMMERILFKEFEVHDQMLVRVDSLVHSVDGELSEVAGIAMLERRERGPIANLAVVMKDLRAHVLGELAFRRNQVRLARNFEAYSVIGNPEDSVRVLYDSFMVTLKRGNEINRRQNELAQQFEAAMGVVQTSY